MEKRSLIRAIAGAFAQPDDLIERFTMEENEIRPPSLTGDKPLPKRKRRFHANAIRRADRNFRGLNKILRLLEPAGVRHDGRAMWAAQQKFGL